MLEHGGRLRAAAQRYGIPLEDWLDLSTGIAPYGWDLPPVPAQAWARLPEITLPPGPALRPGAKGERVALLRARLGLTSGTSFDKELAKKLRAFQADHGLPSDAIAGAKTIAALNRGPAYYGQLLRLNLDRARVLPGTSS